MRKINYWLSSLLVIFASATFAADQQTANTTLSTLQNAVQSIAGTIDDAAITATVATKIATDPLLGPFAVKVATADGMVVLSGTVDSKTQYHRAISLATDTEGVKSVEAKDLVVTPSESPMSDAWVNLKVKTLLFKNEYLNGADFSAWDIGVETHNATVFLVGDVPSEDAKAQVLDIARSVSGVKDVRADLHVMG